MTNKWRGQTATLELELDGTTYPIGVLQDVEIEVEFEIQELYGAGSQKRQDVSKSEIRVSVSADVAEWGFDTWKALIDWDSTDSEIKDSPDVPQFTVTGTFKNSAGDEYSFDITNVVVENIPFGGSYDEYLSMDFEGTGDDITNISEPA